MLHVKCTESLPSMLSQETYKITYFVLGIVFEYLLAHQSHKMNVRHAQNDIGIFDVTFLHHLTSCKPY